MKTSIQIKKKTLKKLKKVKKEYNSPTYDDLINELIKKAEEVLDSMFCIDKGKLKKFLEVDMVTFREY